MLEEFVKNLPALSALGSAIIIVAGGVFSFVRWLDVRRRELVQQRWSDYSKLMSYVAGEAKIPVQMAALFQLVEFGEFSDITVNALEASNYIESQLGAAGVPWTKYIAPQTEKVIALLKADGKKPR